MRPTIGDIINGTKRIIQEVVFPFVAEHSNHPEQPAVMENLLSLMVLLEHAAQRWDKAHLFLEEENRDLCGLLARVNVSGTPWTPQERQSLKALLQEGSHQDSVPVAEPSGCAPDLQSQWESNAKLKEQIAGLLKSLPPNLRPEIEKSLAQLVEREKEWIKVGEVLWD